MTLQTLKVLLIEDDAGDAIIVERMLQRSQLQFTLHHCELLEQSLAQLAENEFDLTLLDLSLPDSFGLTGLDQIRVVSPDVPVVVLTGLSDDNLALQALEQGAKDYLVKGHASAEMLERAARYAIQRQQIQTENRRLLESVEVMARHDPLTGVLNRHSFAENLDREWKRANRQGRPLTCVVLDIDFFKRVNDTYGHLVGDNTLKEVAKTLCQTSRATDVVGRLGGEEFCVLLPDTDEVFAVRWADRVRKKISELVIPTDREDMRITVSLGVASHSQDLEKPQTMVDQADEAMFVAKQLGRDQVVSFSRLRGLGHNEKSEIWNEITVQHLANPLDNSISPAQSLQEAITLLRCGDSETLPVTDEQGGLLGVIGYDDIMAATLTSDDFSVPVGDLMQKRLVSFAPETPAREVCEFLCRAAVPQVFVIGDDEPVSVVRRRDILRWIGDSIDFNSAPRSHEVDSSLEACTAACVEAAPISEWNSEGDQIEQCGNSQVPLC